MAMTLAEFSTFRKTMMMTTSPVDAEALVALRKANAVLLARGYTWEQVLNRVIKVETPIEAASDDPDDLAGLFERAIANASGSFRDTIESIHERWEATGFLSPRQRELIVNTANQIDVPRFKK